MNIDDKESSKGEREFKYVFITKIEKNYSSTIRIIQWECYSTISITVIQLNGRTLDYRIYIRARIDYENSELNSYFNFIIIMEDISYDEYEEGTPLEID